jgi:hypothetical protein
MTPFKKMFIVHTCSHKQRDFQLSPCRVGSQFCSRWGFWPGKKYGQKKNEERMVGNISISRRIFILQFSHDSWQNTKQIGSSGFELDSDSNGSVNRRQKWPKNLEKIKIFYVLKAGCFL